MSLRPKQQLFVQEYLISKNATNAALKAGYSVKTAYQQGHENLRKPEIHDEIQRQLEKQQIRLVMKADDIVMDLIRIINTDTSRAFDKDGKLLPINEIPEDVKKIISSLEITESGYKIKFDDKTKARELLGKHFKLFTDKVEGTLSVEHTGNPEQPIQVEHSINDEQFRLMYEKLERDV